MNYVQNPYFTDQNVEKEKGIIGQEINMYDDEPSWQTYMNLMKLMYKQNPINIDIAGSIESIGKINKEILYKAYNTFYNLSNMTIVVCGDFKPNEILEEIKKRITKKDNIGEIKRIYPSEQQQIVAKEKIETMDVTNPIFAIGFKDKKPTKDVVKKHIAIEIILYMLLGKSSKTYQKLYNQADIIVQPDLDYEFSKNYAHVIISGTAQNPENVVKQLKQAIEENKEKGLNEEEFNRIKKKIYGDYVTEYNEVSNIARMFLADYMKGINSFDYLEEYSTVTLAYANQILKEVFREDNIAVSIVKGKE